MPNLSIYLHSVAPLSKYIPILSCFVRLCRAASVCFALPPPVFIIHCCKRSRQWVLDAQMPSLQLHCCDFSNYMQEIRTWSLAGDHATQLRAPECSGLVEAPARLVARTSELLIVIDLLMPIAFCPSLFGVTSRQALVACIGHVPVLALRLLSDDIFRMGSAGNMLYHLCSFYIQIVSVAIPMPCPNNAELSGTALRRRAAEQTDLKWKQWLLQQSRVTSEYARTIVPSTILDITDPSLPVVSKLPAVRQDVIWQRGHVIQVGPCAHFDGMELGLLCSGTQRFCGVG